MAVYCFDIDGTICSNTDGDYTRAIPFNNRITKIQSLESQGHTIIFFTARGSKTGIDWSDLTVKQLISWGFRDPVVQFSKPFADIYVDDRAHNDIAFFQDG
jgi:hypothetical protein